MFGCLVAGAVGYSAPAYAQIPQEALVFTESGGSLTAQFSGDPSTTIVGTGSADNWTIDLAGSGHTLLNPITGGNLTDVFTYSWIEPENPNSFNNLTYNGDQTFTFVSDSATDAGGANTFSNGVSFSINSTVDSTTAPDNGAGVFYNVNDVSDVPEPASMTLLGLGLAGLGMARRRQRK